MRSLFLLLFALTACEPSSPALPDAGSCPEGQRPLADAVGCEPKVANFDCPPGSMPALGFDDCQPVGWPATACPKGFEPDPSGWGCHEVLPGSACLGAEQEALGNPACQPLGSCAAPFPPPEATLFVDDSYATSQLDATHFRSLLSALRAAPSGATIAVEEGTYNVSLDPKLPVRIIGRCAQKVRLDGLGAGYTGVDVGSKGVELSGLTLTGFNYGVAVFGGASVVVKGCNLEKNHILGLLVTGAGSQATVEGSVVRDTLPDSSGAGWGVCVERGGAAEIRGSAVVANIQAGLVVRDPGSRLRIEDSAILRTAGRGLEASAGATLEVQRSAVVGSLGLAMHLEDWPTVAQVSMSAFRKTRATSSIAGGRGISVTSGARLELSQSALVENGEGGLVVSKNDAAGHRSEALVVDSVVRQMRGNPLPLPGGGAQYLGRGVNLQSGAKVELRGVALVHNEEVGFFANDPGTEFILSRSLVQGTRSNPDGYYGEGLTAQKGARGHLSGSAFLGNRAAGVDVDSGSRLSLVGSVVRGTQPIPADPLAISSGVIARYGAFLEVADTLVDGNAGMGLLFWESQATIRSSIIARNAVGVHLRDASHLREVETLPDSFEPSTILVTSDTRFVGNTVRLGSGVVPLPALPGALIR